MIRYSRTFSRDWPGDTEKNRDPASETVRQTSPQMLAAWVIARRANGVGSAKRCSVGAGGGGRRGGGAVAMAKQRYRPPPAMPGERESSHAVPSAAIWVPCVVGTLVLAAPRLPAACGGKLRGGQEFSALPRALRRPGPPAG